MNHRRIFLIPFLCLLVYRLQLCAQSETITVTARASDNYVIAPGSNYATINFDVRFPGSYPGQKYRYHQYVDNNELYGSPVTFPSTPSARSFSCALMYGPHSIRVSLDKADGSNWIPVSSNSTNVAIGQNYGVVVQNSFDGGSVGGGYVTVDWGRVPSGTSFTWARASSHSVFATDGGTTQNGYTQAFLYWEGFGVPVNGPIWYFNALSDATYTAHFDRLLHVYYQNDFGGEGNGGTIRVRQQYYASPTYSLPCARTQGVPVEAINQPFRGLEYVFSYWSPGGSQSASTLIYAQDQGETFTAHFVFSKPQSPQGAQATGAVGQHVRLTWTVNPHAGVTYRIVRQRKVESQEVATIGVGGHEWTDPDVVVTGTGQDELLQYQIFSVYAGVSSDPSGAVICAKYFPTGNEQDLVVGDEGGEMPTTHRVGNYPNPFNPSTTISYDLPTAASVKIDVFDLMGRRVRSVVDATRSAGCHSAIWNGRDDSGKDVSSGVYVYRFDAIPLDGGKGFRQSGKLMLTR